MGRNIKILIHACPKRMWYVNGFLIPMLKEQGAEDIEVWNDTEKRGNLQACMDSFAARTGDGGTWHIQDDVLPCRDFVKRCRDLDDGIVYGFCCEAFTDDPQLHGKVYVYDAWHSFQCVRIPNAYARECAAWVRSGRWKTESPNPELYALWDRNNGDDTFFHEFLACMHPRDFAENAKPNLVEHVDYIIGGSVLSPYREYHARSDYWEDNDLIEELKKAVKGKIVY